MSPQSDKNRSADRAKIQSIFNGEPPYKEEEVANFNFEQFNMTRRLKILKEMDDKIISESGMSSSWKTKAKWGLK